MGINCGSLILLKEYADRHPLGDLLMYGRLSSTLSRREQARIRRRHGIPAHILTDQYAEALLGHFGAASVQSVDISDHEGCDIVLDLMEDIIRNDKLATQLCCRFDTILDFGTSEHVFNFPQALANAWNMLREGGSYIFDLPITGWTSHGLYQFTPNYFHSVGQSCYFNLDYMFFHGKRGDRIYHIRRYDSRSYLRLSGHKKISAWGVLRKSRPDNMNGGLCVDQLHIMQVDSREDPLGTAASPGKANRTLSINTIASAFTKRD